MGEDFDAAIIKYKRAFDPTTMEKTRFWKILEDVQCKKAFDPTTMKETDWYDHDEEYGYRSEAVPNFTGTSCEELLYCQDAFRTAMKELRIEDSEWFGEWERTLHGTPKRLWEDTVRLNGTDFDRDEAGFAKALERYACAVYGISQDARHWQARAMARSPEFRFRIGAADADVQTHVHRIRTILHHTDELPGSGRMNPNDIKLTIFDTFPKAWKDAFLLTYKTGVGSSQIVDIQWFMDRQARRSKRDDQQHRNKHKKGVHRKKHHQRWKRNRRNGGGRGGRGGNRNGGRGNNSYHHHGGRSHGGFHGGPGGGGDGTNGYPNNEQHDPSHFQPQPPPPPQVPAQISMPNGGRRSHHNHDDSMSGITSTAGGGGGGGGGGDGQWVFQPNRQHHGTNGFPNNPPHDPSRFQPQPPPQVPAHASMPNGGRSHHNGNGNTSGITSTAGGGGGGGQWVFQPNRQQWSCSRSGNYGPSIRFESMRTDHQSGGYSRTRNDTPEPRGVRMY